MFFEKNLESGLQHVFALFYVAKAHSKNKPKRPEKELSRNFPWKLSFLFLQVSKLLKASNYRMSIVLKLLEKKHENLKLLENLKDLASVMKRHTFKKFISSST